MTDKQSAPPYTEEQATRWLAWLAYNMRRHGMTIFQIESLQPNWLLGHLETTTHLVLTRTLWSIWSSLIFTLIFGLTDGVMYALIFGLFFGLFFGLISSLVELIIQLYKLDKLLQSHDGRIKKLVAGTLIYGLSTGLIFELIVGMSFRLLGRLRDELVETWSQIKIDKNRMPC